MKKAWHRITLMRFACDKDDGRIPGEAILGTVAMFMGVCGAYLLALAMVRG